MKAINYLVLGLVCFGSLTLTAQKKTFTMAEAVNGLSSKLAVANWKQLQWAGEQYVYVVNTDSQHVVMSGDPKTRLTHELLSLAELNQALTQKGLHTLKAFPALTFKSETDFYFSNEQQYVECIRRENTWEATLITELPADADPVNVDAGSMHLAYISNDNLYIGGKDLPTRQLTQDGSRDIVYGDSIHRNEFGIEQCMFWSGSGTRLAFYRMDQSMVEAYPIINWNSTPATVNKIRYPFAGRTSHQVQVGVYDINSGHIVYMQTGLPADQYLTTVTWSPDEKYIYISLLNREQNHLRLNQYDAHSGTLIKTLFEEQRDTYVEPQHPLYFLSGDPNHFLWWSQRDGYMHLYRCTTDGDIDTLMHGNWIVNDILGYNPKTSELIYTGTEDSPLQKNVYAIHLNKLTTRCLSATHATHTAQLSASGHYLLDVYSNENIPRQIDVVKVADAKASRLFTAPNPLQDYQLADVRLVTLKAADGTPLYGKLICPPNLDSSKKYPVVVYLYNGPHVQLVKDVFPFSGNLWYDYMAQHGYVMFVMDGRGSSNRGFGFESATFHQLGTVEMEDQLKGVSYLKSLRFIDTNRMGVHGWSFGGFMTTSLMLRHPGVFKVAVAGGPVLDWSQYEVMYTERYMGTPQNNAKGYQTNCLLDKTKNLQGKLLMIHGTQDDTVVWEQSMQFVKKCVDEGVQLDYFVYPGHPHNVRGKDRVHLMQKVSDYFDQYLK